MHSTIIVYKHPGSQIPLLEIIKISVFLRLCFNHSTCVAMYKVYTVSIGSYGDEVNLERIRSILLLVHVLSHS